ncbi:hypothetical protein [Streptomyces sp. NPDC001816]
MGLFADHMWDLGLDPEYGHCLPSVGSEAFPIINLMSLVGLHRVRGA